MTAIARFEVIPVREGSMADTIARAVKALEYYDVTYATTPTDTVIEAETLEELFAAVRAAHEAIAGQGRIVTELEIDYQAGRPWGMDERVRAVERELGRPPRSDRSGGRSPGGREPARYEGGQRTQGTGESGQMQTTSGASQPSRRNLRYGSRRR